MSSFKTLLTLSINHPFYTQFCDDFQFLFVAGSQSLLKKGRLLQRVRDGKLYLLYEADAGGTASRDISGETLVIGLKIVNSLFANFTDIVVEPGSRPVYRNSAAPTLLDAPVYYSVTGSKLRHMLSDAERPVTVHFKNTAGDILEQVTITAGHNRDSADFDLGKYDAGDYEVVENYSLTNPSTRYCYFPDLNAGGVYAQCEVTVASGFYTSAAEFSIDFTPRSDTLKYYVVAHNYTNTDYTQLAVNDAGFTEQARAQIVFDRVEPAAFTAAELDPALLLKGTDKLVLFKSQSSVGRKQDVQKKIQLSLNGEVLVSNLPAPGASKAQADFIIHVAKP